MLLAIFSGQEHQGDVDLKYLEHSYKLNHVAIAVAMVIKSFLLHHLCSSSSEFCSVKSPSSFLSNFHFLPAHDMLQSVLQQVNNIHGGLGQCPIHECQPSHKVFSSRSHVGH